MLSDKIKELYKITNELEHSYPGRKFTIDGHLVGSIGEVIVAEHYGLDLLPNSTKTHDARTKDGKMVQIKATQVKGIAISSEPDYLIVIRLLSDGSWEEIYNGPGKAAWDNAGKMQKNGQRPISLSKLRNLMGPVDIGNGISKKNMPYITEEDGQQIVVATNKTRIVYKFFDLAEGAYILTLRYKSRGGGKVILQTDFGESTAAILPSETWVDIEIPCAFRTGIQPLVLHYQGSREFGIQSFCLHRR